MAFEEATLSPAASTPYDPATVRAWLAEQTWAFLDPVDGKLWHASGRARDAARSKDLRLADPKRFPLGLLIDVRDDVVYLASRADAATLARTRTLVAELLDAGAWTFRIDQAAEQALTLDALFPERLPDAEELVDDALERPVLAGQLVLWEHGDEDAPGGRTAITVHSTGAFGLSRPDGTEIRGELDPLARLAWLEAAAYLDEDDDEIEDPIAPEFLVHVSVETEDDEWALYVDSRELPSSVRPLAHLIEQWLAVLSGWSGEGLPPLPAE